MSKPSRIVVSVIVLTMGAALILEYRAKTQLNDEVVSLRSEIQQFAAQIAALQQEHARLLSSEVPAPAQAPLPEGQLAELADEETRLTVFLEGRQNMVLKLVFRKMGNDWKLARTEF